MFAIHFEIAEISVVVLSIFSKDQRSRQGRRHASYCSEDLLCAFTHLFLASRYLATSRDERFPTAHPNQVEEHLLYYVTSTEALTTRARSHACTCGKSLDTLKRKSSLAWSRISTPSRSHPSTTNSVIHLQPQPAARKHS